MPIQNSIGALYPFRTTSILRPGIRYLPNLTAFFPAHVVGFQVSGGNVLKNPVQTPGYTIEYYVRPVGFTAGAGTGPQKIGNFDPGFTFRWGMGIENSALGSAHYRFEFNGFYFRTTNAIMSSGSWSNIAITFDNDGTNSTIRIFENGILQNIQLNGAGLSETSKTFLSSTATWNNAQPFSFYPQNRTGSPVVYYDEIRISNVCRYTANYSLSPIPFLNDANTLALFQFNYNPTQSLTNTIIDSGPNNFTITNERSQQQLGEFPYPP